MTRVLCAILCAVLLAIPPAATAQSTVQAKPSIKEQILLTPAGSSIEVKLLDKRKLRGRMGPVTDTGFSLQYVEKDKVQETSINFTEVKSFRQREQGMGTGSKVALGILAGVGATFLVLWAVFAVAYS